MKLNLEKRSQPRPVPRRATQFFPKIACLQVALLAVLCTCTSPQILLAQGATTTAQCRQTWTIAKLNTTGVICRGNPGKPAFLLFHGLHQSAETWTKPSSTQYNFDYRHTPKDHDLGKHAGPNAGVYKVEQSDILDVDRANWFDFLALQGYTVATWSQPGAAFDPAYKSAQAAFEQFLADTTSLNPAAPPPIVLLAHSRGGLLIRKILKEYPQAKGRVRWVITLHTPHHGSQVAVAPGAIAEQTSELFNNVQLPPDVHHPLKQLALLLVTPLTRMVDEGSRELAPESAILKDLETGEHPLEGASYYTFGGTQPTLFRMYTWLFTPMSAVPQYKNLQQYFDWQVKAAEVPLVSPILDKVRAVVPEIKAGYGDSLVTDQSARLPAAFNAIHQIDQLNHAEVLWNPDVQHRVVAIVSGRSIQVPVRR